nr:unnamed protein product [Callosobruchus analis]
MLIIFSATRANIKHTSTYNRHLRIHYEIKPFVILNNHVENDLLIKSITNKIHACPHCDYKVVYLWNIKKT